MRNINIDFYNSGNTIILGYTNEHLATSLNFILPAEFRNGYSYKLIFNLENNQEYMELFASYPITYKVSNVIMSAGTSGHLQLSVLKKQDNGEVMVAQSGIIPFKVLSSLADNNTEIGEYTNTIETLIAEFVANLQDINSRELKANKIVTNEQIINKEENYPSIQYLEDNYPTNDDVYLVDEADNKFLASDGMGNVLTQHLKNGAVTTEKIANNAVTTEKIADKAIITNKLANQSVTSEKLATTSVTTSKIADGAINTSHIIDGAIKETKIADGAVVSSKITDNAITTEKIANNAVTTDKIGLQAVTFNKIAENAVLNQHIANGSVTDEKINKGAVTAEKIASNSVELHHFSPILQSKLNSKLDKPSVDGTAGQVLALSSDDGSTLWKDIQISTNEIGDKVVTTEKIQDGAITSKKVAEGALYPIHINSYYLDDAPKPASGTGAHLVTSAGVYNALKEKIDKPTVEGTAGQVLMTSGGENGNIFWGTVSSSGEGGEGTSNYLDLENKPSINDIELIGNISLEELGIENGVDGVGIQNITEELSSEDGGYNNIIITLTDGTEHRFVVKNGSKGSKGNSIRVTFVQENLDDGGENIVTFSDGNTLAVKNGSKGSKGDTPVRGVDYWTEADKQEIINTIEQNVDTVLSTESTKPVQNKIITEELEKKLDNVEGIIKTDNLGNKSVTNEKIANGAITSSKIGTGAISTSNLSSEIQNKLDLINSKLNKPSSVGLAGQVLMTSGGENGSVFWGTVSSLGEGGEGGEGTSNYLDLENKPSINDIELIGNITTDELGIKNGVDGVGIVSIEQQGISSEDNGKNYITATLSDGTQSTFVILNGSKGSTGNSVTTTFVQESLDDGGTNIVSFSDGNKLSVKNGSKGSTGEKGDKGDKGDTPVKGVDYFTDEDLAKLKAELSQIETPTFANSVEECTDTSKLYVLPDGYIYAYTTKTTTHTPVNQIKSSIDTDGTSYNDGIGYITGYTLHGSDGSDYSGSSVDKVTGYISCKNGDYIRSNGMGFKSTGGYKRIAFYDADFTCFTVLSTGSTYKPLDDYLDGENLSFNISDIELLTEEQKEKVAYIRASCNDIGSNSIITVNESTETTTETVTDWHNTNLAFIPADYEDRIIALENNRYSKSRHDDKVCVCFGDSIVANMAEPNDYPSVLADETGMTVYNVGFGGCRMSASMSTVYNAYSMVKLADAITTGDWTEQENGLSSVTISHYAPHIETLKSIDWSKVDFITIGYGTNDIANFVDVDNTEKPLDTTTVLGGLRYSLNTILTAYPHIKVLILTPIYRYFNDEGVDSNEKEWYEQRKFTTWTDGILDVAKEYGVPAVDMYRTLGFNKLTRNYYFPSNDGTHPNEIGLKVIGGKIAGKLLSEY